MGISAVIITLNEETKIKRCLGSLMWADEIVVVDCGSKDKTVEFAQKTGAQVFHREFDNFSSQRNYAIEKANLEWVLFVDADEKITPELAKEIRDASKNSKHKGYNIPRSNIIFGREMKYGGHQGDKHLRLFRRDSAKCLNPIHEKIVVDGSIGDLKNPIIHYSTGTKKEYSVKLDFYTDLEAKFLIDSGAKVPRHYVFSKPVCKFLKQYFLQKGFLDRKAGLEFYGLSAYNVFLKYKKYFALVNNSRGEK